MKDNEDCHDDYVDKHVMNMKEIVTTMIPVLFNVMKWKTLMTTTMGRLLMLLLRTMPTGTAIVIL